MVIKLRRPRPATILITVFFKSNFPKKKINENIKIPFYMTCPALDNDDKLDPISFVQSPPPLLMEMCVAEVPTNRVQQSKIVPGVMFHNMADKKHLDETHRNVSTLI